MIIGMSNAKEAMNVFMEAKLFGQNLEAPKIIASQARGERKARG